MKEVAVPSVDNPSSDQQPPNEVASESHDELQRGLDSRHMNMIAIGGAIGTGLFLASGATISQAGPGGALVAFVVIGLMVFLLMQSLGEMTAHMPVAGSFQTWWVKRLDGTKSAIVPLDKVEATPYSLGVDWFILSLFFSAIVFIPLERYLAHSPHPQGLQGLVVQLPPVILAHTPFSQNKPRKSTYL